VREAPAYTADRAQQLFDEWRKGELALADFAAKHALVTEKTKVALSAGDDPAGQLLGLTEKILMTPEVPKQIVEIRDLSILAEIREFKEPTIPGLAEVKDRVVAAYRRQQSKVLADEAGARMVGAFEGDQLPDFSKVAAEQKLTVLDSESFSRSKPPAGALGSAEIQNAIFNTTAALHKPTKVFDVAGKGYIFQVKEIKAPEAAKATERIGEYKTRAAERNVQTLIGSVLAKLKADATIDVEPQLLASNR